MFNVDTRTTLTLARLRQDDVVTTFPRGRRKSRPEASLSTPVTTVLTGVGALPVAGPRQPQPGA